MSEQEKKDPREVSNKYTSGEDPGIGLREATEKLKKIRKRDESAPARSKEINEVAGLRRKVGELQETKNEIFRKLGDLVYFMHHSNAFDEEIIKETCEPIAQIDKKIRDAKEKIAKIQSDTPGICNCGTEVLEGSSFCINRSKKK